MTFDWNIGCCRGWSADFLPTLDTAQFLHIYAQKQYNLNLLLSDTEQPSGVTAIQGCYVLQNAVDWRRMQSD